jgi:protease-4
MPQRLLELKWVDAVASPDTLRDLARQVAGRRPLFQKAKAARAARWMPDESWGPRPTVALVYAIGECAMDTGIRGRETSKALEKFRKRRDVKAVVLRADSPGGDPLASDLVAREMMAYRKAGKPLLVSMGRVAGSGGYWISMNAARINASPFTLTGSIGVIGGWAWDEGLGKKLGLTYDKVQLGKSADLLGGLRIPFIGIQIPERNLDEREHVVMKNTMLSLYDDFTRRVALGRGLPVDRVREIAQGHVYMGRRALEIKLVDEIASLDGTIEEAKSAARISTGRRVRIEEYPRPSLFRMPSLIDSPVRMFLRQTTAIETADTEPWTYEQRGLAWMLKNPGTPLLLTPASLLPDEAAPR